MNITSAIVGVSIMAVAMPGVANMSIQPVIAQARVNNLAEAESKAITFAALNEGATFIQGDAPDGCTLFGLSNNVYSITCEEGEDQLRQTATRSFRLIPDTPSEESSSCDDNDGNNGHGNSGGYDCSNPGNSNKNKNKNK